MSKGYRPEDLAGVRDLARILDVKPSVISSWNARADKLGFATPITNLQATPVYSITEYLLGWDEWEPRHFKVGKLNPMYSELLKIYKFRVEEARSDKFIASGNTLSGDWSKINE